MVGSSNYGPSPAPSTHRDQEISTCLCNSRRIPPHPFDDFFLPARNFSLTNSYPLRWKLSKIRLIIVVLY
jgi:hypothetical protein